MKLESSIEREVCKHADKTGWVQTKIKSESSRGWPDRIFMQEGFMFYIEFKSKGKLPRKYQQRIHKQITKSGFEVYIIDNVKDGKKLLDRLKYENIM